MIQAKNKNDDIIVFKCPHANKIINITVAELFICDLWERTTFYCGLFGRITWDENILYGKCSFQVKHHKK